MKKLIPLLLMAVMVIILGSCTGNTEREPDITADNVPVTEDVAENVPEAPEEDLPAVTDEPNITEPETEEPADPDPEPMGHGAQPPIMKPEDLPLDEETAALANEIIEGLSDDMELVREILHLRKLEPSAVSNGVDLYGNIVYLDVTLSDGTVLEHAEFIPFLEPYDTIENCMAIIRSVYTEEHSERLYSDFFVDKYLIQEVDGKLYGGLADRIDFSFDVPIQNAVRVSDDEIIAITTITYDITQEIKDYEITLKNENGEWRVDGRFIVDYYGEDTWYEEDC